MHPIGPHIIGGFEGLRITPKVKRLIKEFDIGGFILFKRNIRSVDQVKGLIKRLQDLAGRELFMGVDQEGGGVFRLGPPFTVLPPMAVLGNFYRKTKQADRIREVGRILARELKAVGFNWDYAPVVDVHSNPRNPIIGKRSFGPDPNIVTACAKALIEGLHDEGVISCAKHFPGHGATELDSHLELPVLEDLGRLLWKRDMLPYRKLIPSGHIKTIMTAHVLYPDLDPQHCATLSRNILYNILRRKIKFKGVIVSDDMWMKGISDKIPIPKACEEFFMASGDMVLICRQPQSQLETIEYLTDIYEKNSVFQARLAQAQKRVEKLRNEFLVSSKAPDLSVIGQLAHRDSIQIFKAYS